jgi:amylosucrase
MALLWDGIATKSTRLLSEGIKSLATKLDRATWLNYVRCHDDIGFGFNDSDIRAAGYDPYAHRQFLVDYFCGLYDDTARGLAFMRNEATGDARICGSLASLVGLESALERQDEQLIHRAIDRIVLLHGVIFSFGGIPLIYNGDALGVLNDYSFRDDPDKQEDNRWVHRPKINWQQAEQRKQPGTVEFKIFTAMQRMIAIRKQTSAFADFNNRELLPVANDHVLCFQRADLHQGANSVLVLANFDASPQQVEFDDLCRSGSSLAINPALHRHCTFIDLVTGDAPTQFDGSIVLKGYQFYWLRQQG